LSVTGPYDSESAVDQYLLFHYGTRSQIFPFDSLPDAAFDFHSTILRRVQELHKGDQAARGLDLGCATGRCAFEMSAFLDEVHGVDTSEHFIAAARALQEHGFAHLRVPVEGRIAEETTIRLRPEWRPERVRFSVADALDVEPGNYDVVLAINLLDRVRSPARLLAKMPALVAPGGLLVVASPFTWLPDFTPEDEWLEPHGQDRADEILSCGFSCVAAEDLPFVIREHARKFQFCVARVSYWRFRTTAMLFTTGR
jgi:putative 4-mercaptohistidine N1-methyltranferase